VGYAESAGYIDAVGDINGARLGPYVSSAAAQADYAARQQKKQQVPVPSRGWFQVRSLRPDYTGPMNAADKLRVASLLGDAEYNARTAFAISSGGTKWDLWSTFAHGTYEQYLDMDYELKTGHARAADWDF